MKYKVGDKVRIKSLDWYNENKDEGGYINCGSRAFFTKMSDWCGKILTINRVVEEFKYYCVSECIFSWTDEMIEGLVQDENNHLIETVVDYVKESNDRYRIVIDPRFDIEVDEGEYYAVRRKKEYPKTYEECCKILDITPIRRIGDIGYKRTLLNVFEKLLVCRDAYWKIAGEEMGLGKPWEPDWKNEDDKFIIQTCNNKVGCWSVVSTQRILAFPTEEMRDAFKENFDPDIEICKEFL